MEQIIKQINKKTGYNLTADYYAHIDTWDAWWRGFYAPFHEYRERAGDNAMQTRRIYTLNMAKKVCEDWAAILLNEQTQIDIEDEASAVFLLGDNGEGGVLGDNAFWAQGNATVERAFATGTGAFVVKLNDMSVTDSGAITRSKEARISIDYLPAQQIVPITTDKGRITEAAFVSEDYTRGAHTVYIETHLLEPRGYVISNQYFVHKDGELQETAPPDGVAAEWRTGTDTPLFAIFAPNTVNTIKGAHGMGAAIFAQAVDNLRGVDLAFNNLCRDFKLGGKKVFYNKDMVRTDSAGNRITPDDAMQQLFIQIGDEFLDERGQQKMVHEFNPTLRVTENTDGIQAQLDYLSFRCGLGTKHYQFNAGSIVTATQYSGDKQELVQNAAKHYLAIDQALHGLIRAVLWAGKEVLGEAVNPDADIKIHFEDGYIIDKEAERARDLVEVQERLMQPWEYRVKWYGEDEETAKAMLPPEAATTNPFGFLDN